MHAIIPPDQRVSDLTGVKSALHQIVFPHVSDGWVPGVTGNVVALYLSTGSFLVFAGVILPAVWSKKAARRRAAREMFDRLVQVAFDLIDRLLRFLRWLLRWWR